MKRTHPLEAPTLALALALAALGGASNPAGLVLAYLASWLVIETFARTRWADAVRQAPRPWLGLVALLAALSLARGLGPLAAEEGLVHWPRLIDRGLGPARLDPPFLRADAPQSFVVHAPGAERVTVALGGRSFSATPIGAGALRLDVDPAGLALEGGRTALALTIDERTEEIALEVIAARARPTGLVLSPDRSRACAVSPSTDELLLIDGARTERRVTADRPIACGFAPEGPVVFTEGIAAAQHGTTTALLRRTLGAGLMSELVVRTGGERRLPLPGLADRVALVPSGAAEPERAIVALRAPSRLLVVGLDPLRIEAERPLQAPVSALVVETDRVVLAAPDFAERPAPNLGNHFVDEQLVALSLPALEVLGVRRLAARTAAQDHAGDVDAFAGVSGLSVDAAGRLVVAHGGTRDVAVLARLDAVAERIALRGVDAGGDEHAPESAVVLADGTLVVASPASGALLRVRGGRVAIEALAPDRSALLRDDPEALRERMGELAFGEATRSGIACTSCHPDGGSDFVAHNIGGRMLAPTLDARGLLGTAPYLRDGSYPRIRDLLEVAEDEYRGYRWPAGDRGATIEGYLARTVRPPIVAAPDPALVRQGGELFERAGCAGCHAPPRFTDLGQHAAVALFPRHAFPGRVRVLDTPSLRGLSESPPYLYDGRARTLRDVLTTENTADQHGATAGLSEPELDALVAFLEAIP